MSLLIINTLEEDDPAGKDAIHHLSAKTPVHTISHTEKMKIAPCIGCNACWLKTPGVCAVKDDYEQILKACLQQGTLPADGCTTYATSSQPRKILLRVPE